MSYYCPILCISMVYAWYIQVNMHVCVHVNMHVCVHVYDIKIQTSVFVSLKVKKVFPDTET